jgi:hypothetical protein
VWQKPTSAENWIKAAKCKKIQNSLENLLPKKVLLKSGKHVDLVHLCTPSKLKTAAASH